MHSPLERPCVRTASCSRWAGALCGVRVACGVWRCIPCAVQSLRATNLCQFRACVLSESVLLCPPGAGIRTQKQHRPTAAAHRPTPRRRARGVGAAGRAHVACAMWRARAHAAHVFRSETKLPQLYNIPNKV
eukprot:scaffold102346_cov90-Phaeocystis_antarctica.AAC.3